MKQNIILQIITCGLILVMMPNSYCEDKRLVIVGEEFPPFEFVQSKKVVGIDIDISSQIFNKMNIPVEYQSCPGAGHG